MLMTEEVQRNLSDTSFVLLRYVYVRVRVCVCVHANYDNLCTFTHFWIHRQRHDFCLLHFKECSIPDDVWNGHTNVDRRGQIDRQECAIPDDVWNGHTNVDRRGQIDRQECAIPDDIRIHTHTHSLWAHAHVDIQACMYVYLKAARPSPPCTQISQMTIIFKSF